MSSRDVLCAFGNCHSVDTRIVITIERAQQRFCSELHGALYLLARISRDEPHEGPATRCYGELARSDESGAVPGSEAETVRRATGALR